MSMTSLDKKCGYAIMVYVGKVGNGLPSTYGISQDPSIEGRKGDLHVPDPEDRREGDRADHCRLHQAPKAPATGRLVTTSPDN